MQQFSLLSHYICRQTPQSTSRAAPRQYTSLPLLTPRTASHPAAPLPHPPSTPGLTPCHSPRVVLTPQPDTPQLAPATPQRMTPTWLCTNRTPCHRCRHPQTPATVILCMSTGLPMMPHHTDTQVLSIQTITPL